MPRASPRSTAARAIRDFDPHHAKETLNRWIAHETAKAGREVTAAIEAYKFNDAAAAIYRFVWNVYCDWYLELIKPVLTGPDGAAKSETRAAAAWALDEILKTAASVHAVHHRRALGASPPSRARSAITCWRSTHGRRTTASMMPRRKARSAG